jgi:hypothetical protein
MIVTSQILSPSAIDEYLTALAPRPIEADRMTGTAVDS